MAKKAVRLSNAITSEVAYSEDQLEFLKAMDTYIVDNRRKFPTWCEVLAVLEALGWRKVEKVSALPVFVRGSGEVNKGKKRVDWPGQTGEK